MDADSGVRCVSSSKLPLCSEGGVSIIDSEVIFNDDVEINGLLVINPPPGFTGKLVTINGNLDVTGVIDPTGMVFAEQSVNPQIPTAGEGTLWVRDDTPNVLIFTDDAGTDHVLTGAGAVTTLTSAGGTESLVVDGVGPTLSIRGLTAGTGISLTGAATDVTIANTDPGSSVTLQAAYDNSGATPIIVLDDADGGILIRDDTGPAVTGSLFAIQDNTGVTNYMTVSATEITLDRNTTINGDLAVTGTTTTIDTQTLNVEDNYILLNSNYDSDTALRCGQVYNIDPEPGVGQDTVAGAGFTAGVAAVSNPTVATTSASTFADTQFVIITGANDNTNNGVFEVLSHAANLLTIRGVGLTGNTAGIDFMQDQFATDATVAGTITRVVLSVLRARTDGSFECGSGSDAATINGDFAIIVKSAASAGGTESLVATGTGPDLSFKGLTAGANITLTPSGTDVTIASTASGGGLTTVLTFTATPAPIIVPAGVSVMTAYCQGGGGGGGNGLSAPNGTTGGGAGGGGGSGIYNVFVFTVTAGDTLTITVGAGGAAATNGANTTIVRNVATVASVEGGRAGANASGITSQDGGAGGIGDYGGGGGGRGSGTSVGTSGSGGLGAYVAGFASGGVGGGQGAPGPFSGGPTPTFFGGTGGAASGGGMIGGGGGGGCPTRVPELGSIGLAGGGGTGGSGDGAAGGAAGRFGAGGGGGAGSSLFVAPGTGGAGRGGYVVLVY